MSQEYYINCPTCDHPNRVRTSLQSIHFPDDVDSIVAIIEGTLNAITCPVCEKKVNLFVPLVTINSNLKSIIVLIPEKFRRETEKEIGELSENLAITYCKDYSELYFAMAPWINSIIVPALNEIFSGSLFDRSLEEQLSMLSPLILRIIKSQIDGKPIEKIVKFGGQVSEDEQKKYLNKYHTLVVTHLIRQLLDLACRSREIPQLDSIVRHRIPSICLTQEVLSEIIEDCIELKDTAEDQENYRKGFLREYLNATIHSHSNTINPRGESWAAYLRIVWLLSQDKNVNLDTQFILSRETIRRTVRFQDLWDITQGGISHKSWKNRAEFEEGYNDVWEMMKHFGFEKEFEEMHETPPIRIKVEPGKELPAELFSKSFLKTIFTHYSFNLSTDKSIELGNVVGRIVDNLLNNGQRQAASLVVERVLDRALEAKDYYAAAATGTKTVEAMNKAEDYSFAANIIHKLLPLIQDKSIHVKLSATKPLLMLDFFNEMGNVLRYLHFYEMALNAYQMAEKINLFSFIPEEKRNPNNLSVLRRNQAIIYREMGKFRKAKEIFDSEIKQRPDDHSLIYNLVTLELQTNRFEKALLYLDQAISLIDGKMAISERSEYLLTRGILRHALGNENAGLDDLIAAYETSASSSSIRTLRVAAAAMKFHSEQPQHREFITKCSQVLIEELKSKRCRSNPSLVLTMAGAIAERYLEEKRPEELPKSLLTEFDWLDSLEGDLPWQYHFIRGWLAYQLGKLDSCWPRFELALEKIDLSVPFGEDVSFAPSWMQDKERFQEILSSVAVQLVDCQVLETKELLKVYEFTNGREIISRLESRLSPDDIIEIVQQHSQKANRTVDIFFPIDAGETIRICHLSSSTDKPVKISDQKWNKNEIGLISEQTYLALKQANPDDLAFLDNRIQDWDQLSAEIGNFIEPRLATGSHVCFLPGRDLTGLPLHLLRMSSGNYLLEKTTVTFAPNFATLLAPSKQSKSIGGSVAIVTVTKKRDIERFRSRALKVNHELCNLLRQTHHIHELTELQANHKAVIDLFQHVDQIFFICHGADAGPGRGFGICVADEHQLPPSLFPISELPDLERFILTWDDFEEVEACPRVVVSIACSSGRTRVEAGGTRFGLEQTLFGKGTRTLISPLWDVDQESGLEWLKKFCQLNSQYPEKSLQQVYRETSLALKERFSHPYFWGCFTINGSLFSEDKL